MSKEWNQTIDQGSTFDWQFNLTNPDGTPMNLTGFSLRGMLRRTVDASSVELDLSQSSRLTITDAVNGIARLLITATDTAALSGSYKYDIELYNVSEVHRIVEGVFTVSKEVTR